MDEFRFADYHSAPAGEVAELTAHALVDFEPEGPTDSEASESSSAPSQAGLRTFAEQYAVTSDGIKTNAEAFEAAGLVTTCSNKTLAFLLALYNRSGEVEHTAGLVHCGRCKLINIAVRSGGMVKTASKHRFFVMNKSWWSMQEAADLKPGDFVMMQRTFAGPVDPPSHFSNDCLYVIGNIIADGHVGRISIRVTNDDPVVQAAVVEYGSEIFGFAPRVYKKKGSTGSLAYHFNSKAAVTTFLQTVGWESCVAAGKHLGRLIRSLDTKGVRAVLQGYVDCECRITPDGSIVINSASWHLLGDVKLILLVHFGIIATLRPNFCSKYPDNEYWNLDLNGAEAQSYADLVGFRSVLRQEQVKRWVHKDRNPNLDVVPGMGDLLSAIHGWSETTREHVHLIRDYKGHDPRANVTYQRLACILDASWTTGPALDRLREVHEARSYHDEVLSLQQVEPEPVFDFDMPGSHTYILGGFVSRNSADRVACSLELAA